MGGKLTFKLTPFERAADPQRKFGVVDHLGHGQVFGNGFAARSWESIFPARSPRKTKALRSAWPNSCVIFIKRIGRGAEPSRARLTFRRGSPASSTVSAKRPLCSDAMQIAGAQPGLGETAHPVGLDIPEQLLFLTEEGTLAGNLTAANWPR
jgi:hypothetical protein